MKKNGEKFKPWEYRFSMEYLCPPGMKNQYAGEKRFSGDEEEITREQAWEIDHYWQLRRAVKIIERERCEKIRP